MLVDVTRRTWYRDGIVPPEQIIDPLSEARRQLGRVAPSSITRLPE
jgi:hypothetical protein